MKLKSGASCLITGSLPRSREPEARYTQSGKKVVSFSVKAGSVKNDDGTYTDDWINCTAWGDMADICERLRPGQNVLVCGRLNTRTWTGRDGDERTSTELIVDFASGCGPVAAPAHQGEPAAAPTFDELEDSDGDLPF